MLNNMVELAQTGLEEEQGVADQNCQNWSAWFGLNGSSPLGFFLNSSDPSYLITAGFQTIISSQSTRRMSPPNHKIPIY